MLLYGLGYWYVLGFSGMRIYKNIRWSSPRHSGMAMTLDLTGHVIINEHGVNYIHQEGVGISN